jgi:hypothetical protein
MVLILGELGNSLNRHQTTAVMKYIHTPQKATNMKIYENYSL